MGDHSVEIRIDKATCMGSGNCVFLAPATFLLGDDGHSEVLDAAATSEDVLVTAAEGCPVGAISLWRGGVRIDKGRP